MALEWGIVQNQILLNSNLNHNIEENGKTFTVFSAGKLIFPQIYKKEIDADSVLDHSRRML